MVNNNSTHFKLDSGAKVTVVGNHLPWVRQMKLVHTSKILYGHSRMKLPIVGMAVISLLKKCMC